MQEVCKGCLSTCDILTWKYRKEQWEEINKNKVTMYENAIIKHCVLIQRQQAGRHEAGTIAKSAIATYRE